MKSDITIIIVLYKTNLKRIKYLNNLKDHKLLVFEQDTKKNKKKKNRRNFKF